MPDEKERKQTADEGADGSKSKKTAPKKRSRAALYTVIILCIVAFGGIIGYFVAGQLAPNSQTPPNVVSYPTVTSSLASSKDGTVHTIDVDFTVEYADKAEESVSSSEVQKTMQDAVAKIDYEDLKGEYGIDYIENQVKISLKEVAGDEKVSEVYVGNIAIDFPGLLNNTNKQQQNDSEERLKGLFKNLQN